VKKASVLLTLLLLASAMVGCNRPAPTPPPGTSAAAQTTAQTTAPPTTNHDWQTDTPQNHAVDAVILQKLHEAVQKIDIYSIVIVKDGRLIDEYYKQGYDRDSVFRFNSCTKSVNTALLGIALDKGILKSVDTKLTEFFPQLAGTEKSGITLAHLLTHTTGIAWPESGGPMFRDFVSSENWVDFVLAQPMAAKPGARFNYSTGGSHLLSAVLQQASGQTMETFAREHLAKPLGMDSVQWNVDPQGITDGGNGISMTARDAARFGQLYLNGGAWNGQRILSEEWVEKSTTPQSAAQPNSAGYGYQWWLRKFSGMSGYYAVGHAGQYIVVVPELSLVAVSTGRFPSGRYPFLDYFEDYIVKACTPNA